MEILVVPGVECANWRFHTWHARLTVHLHFSLFYIFDTEADILESVFYMFKDGIGKHIYQCLDVLCGKHNRIAELCRPAKDKFGNRKYYNDVCLKAKSKNMIKE